MWSLEFQRGFQILLLFCFVEENIEIRGKQNSLFPKGPVIKCLILFVIKLPLYFCNEKIAIFFFSNTFSKVQANSNQIWKFQRYQLILEYAHRPVLVPPFIIFNHLYLMYKACCRPRCCNKKNNLHRKRTDKKLSECKWLIKNIQCKSVNARKVKIWEDLDELRTTNVKQ